MELMKENKVAIFAVVLMCAALLAPHASASRAKRSSDASMSERNVKIVFSTQEYEGDNIVEIPYFEYDGERNDTIESINRAYHQGLRRQYAEFADNAVKGEFIEIRSYPFTSKDYLQVVTTYCAYPVYGTDGDLSSVNYDVANNSWMTVGDAMKRVGLDNGKLLYKVSRLFEPEFDGQAIDEVKAAGFLLQDGAEEKFIRLLLEITTVSADGDRQKSFYSYIPAFKELYRMNANCLFDPFEPDQAEPPLAYQTENGCYEPQLGGEIIEQGVIYTGSAVTEDDPVALYQMARGLYYDVLLNIYGMDDYGENDPIYIGIIGIHDIEGENGCYLFEVKNKTRGEFMFAVSRTGNVYQIGDGLGIRVWGNIDEPG